jgi:hypothetical protein
MTAIVSGMIRRAFGLLGSPDARGAAANVFALGLFPRAVGVAKLVAAGRSAGADS